MKMDGVRASQGGVALIVALLFLLVVTIISVVAASNSRQGLKMAANMQDSAASFQAAESGVFAVLSLANTPQNPFKGMDQPAPFAAFDPNSDHPLRDVFGGADSVDVDVVMGESQLPCPRSAAGSSVGLFECDYYRVTSQHEIPHKARSGVQIGVVKTTIGSGIR